MANELEVAAKEAFWREYFERQREGGDLITRYCREHRLPQSSFYGWRQKLGKRGAIHDPQGIRGLPSRCQTSTRPRKSLVRATPSGNDVAPGSVVRLARPRCEPARSDGIGLVALDIVPDASPQSSIAIANSTLEIVCSGGVVVRLREEVSSEVLQRVMIACAQSHRAALKSLAENHEVRPC